MKKIFLGLTLSLVALLTACTQTTSALLSLSSNEDIISLQALAAANLLDVSSSTMSLTSTDINEDPVDEPLEPIVVDTIEPYIELVEQLLGSNNGLNVIVDVSDDPLYENMMTFETSSLIGETQSYTIYYNMTVEEEDDDESEFVLDGIMLVDDLVYTLTGKREVEENEEKVEFIAKLDDLNYVESEFKVESTETEFEILVVENGIEVSQTKVKIEAEDNETKVELEFMSGANTGVYEFKFETEDGQPILKVEFDATIDGVVTQGEITLSIVVDEITGETYYEIFVETEDGEYEEDIVREIEDEVEDEE